MPAREPNRQERNEEDTSLCGRIVVDLTEVANASRGIDQTFEKINQVVFFNGDKVRSLQEISVVNSLFFGDASNSVGAFEMGENGVIGHISELRHQYSGVILTVGLGGRENEKEEEYSR